MLHRRHYSPEDANALLPIVGRTVRELREASRRMAAAGLDADLALRAETSGGAWPGRERAAAGMPPSGHGPPARPARARRLADLGLGRPPDGVPAPRAGHVRRAVHRA